MWIISNISLSMPIELDQIFINVNSFKCDNYACE